MRAAPPRPRRYSADVWDTESTLAVTLPGDRWSGGTGDTIEEDRVLSVADIGLVSALTEREMVLQALHAAVDQARDQLPTEDDWDGEGSPGFQPATFERARHFLIEGARRLWDARQATIPTPRVWGGPEGSLDVSWRLTGRELLVNVPAAEDEPISLYGDDASSEVKAEFEADADTAWVFDWLAR